MEILSAALLGRRLRSARINLGMTQGEVAKAVDIPRTALVQLEAGNRSVDFFKVIQLAKLYQVDLSLLLEDEVEDANPLVALFRMDPQLSNNSKLKDKIVHFVEVFQEGTFLEQLLEDRMRSLPPSYDFPDPRSYTEAVKQGQELANQERQRLSLGFSPISDIPELIANQDIWIAAISLPEELSGVFLHHPDIGMVILVNREHSRARCRFSYAHEYAHALVDRKRSAAVTSRSNANELIEKRANAFASEFLMPAKGVDAVLSKLNRGGQSRESFWLYDVASDEVSYGERRVVAASRKVLSQDVALIAHEFQVSYQAAAYKLNDMRCVSRQQLNDLLAQKQDGQKFLNLLKLRNPERKLSSEESEQPNFTGQIGRLAVEAYRRGEIEREHLLQICQKLGISGEALLMFAE